MSRFAGILAALALVGVDCAHAESHEAIVGLARDAGASVIEEMRIYGSDGTHLTVQLSRTPHTVTATFLNDIAMTDSEWIELAEAAVRCPGGHAETVIETRSVLGAVYSYECVLPLPR